MRARTRRWIGNLDTWPAVLPASRARLVWVSLGAALALLGTASVVAEDDSATNASTLSGGLPTTALLPASDPEPARAIQPEPAPTAPQPVLFSDSLITILTNAPPEPAETAAPPSPDGPEVRPLQALLTSTNVAAALVSTNDWTPIIRPPTNATTDVVNYQQRLDQARQQRRDEDLRGAEKNLVWLLESPAPDELKRPALIELALLAQQQKDLLKAQQIYAQYLRRYPDDPSVPEIQLRQGLIYRQLGAPVLAVSKFYAVISSSIRLKLDKWEYYQRLVLQAQAEIAETYYQVGRYDDAIDYLARLLRLKDKDLDRAAVQFRLVRCYAAAQRDAEVVAQARNFLDVAPAHPGAAEVRYLLARALRQLGQRDEALQVVRDLLASGGAEPGAKFENLLYWQHRTGNELANDLYQQGDLVNALLLYEQLAQINPAPAWQLPAWYQAALIHERCEQPAKALAAYDRILARAAELGTNAPPSVAMVVDMTRWRRDHLQWRDRAEARLRAQAPAEPLFQTSSVQ